MAPAKKVANKGGALVESALSSAVLLGAAAVAASLSTDASKGLINRLTSARSSGRKTMGGGAAESAVVQEMGGGAKKGRGRARKQKGGEYYAFVSDAVAATPEAQSVINAQPSPVSPPTQVDAMHGGRKTRKAMTKKGGAADLAEQYAQYSPNLNFMMSTNHASAVPAMLAADPNAPQIPLAPGVVGMPAVMAGGRKKRATKKGGAADLASMLSQAVATMMPPPTQAAAAPPSMKVGGRKRSSKSKKGGAPGDEPAGDRSSIYAVSDNAVTPDAPASATPASSSATPTSPTASLNDIDLGVEGAAPTGQSAGRRRKAVRKAKRGGSDEEEENEEDQDGGRRHRLRKPRKARKARRGGSEDEEDEEEEEEEDDSQEGGRRRRRKPTKGRKARRGGSDDEEEEEEDKDSQEGGKRRKARATKKGGAGYPAAEAAPGVIESNLTFMMKGGKADKKATKKEKAGGSLNMYQDQLSMLTKQLNALNAF